MRRERKNGKTTYVINMEIMVIAVMCLLLMFGNMKTGGSIHNLYQLALGLMFIKYILLAIAHR